MEPHWKFQLPLAACAFWIRKQLLSQLWLSQRRHTCWNRLSPWVAKADLDTCIRLYSLDSSLPDPVLGRKLQDTRSHPSFHLSVTSLWLLQSEFSESPFDFVLGSVQDAIEHLKSILMHILCMDIHTHTKISFFPFPKSHLFIYNLMFFYLRILLWDSSFSLLLYWSYPVFQIFST